ncbi:MAG: cation-translocating P-type ATPase C-terminal domain-containing protein, partial [Deltaproteobacteria bacterium]
VRYGAGSRAGSLADQSLTAGQLLHALSCRSEKHTIFEQGALLPNRHLNLALGGSFALQAVASMAPGLRSLLGLGPFGLVDLAVVGATAVLPLVVNETKKKF